VTKKEKEAVKPKSADNKYVGRPNKRAYANITVSALRKANTCMC